jgi:hypothetical protein
VRTGWLVLQQRTREHPAPARTVLALVAIHLLVIAVGVWIVVRAYGDRPHPARVGTSQSACSTSTPIPQGYSPCDPIPTNTGFQTGDKG